MSEFPRSGAIDTYIDELLNETNTFSHVKLDMASDEKGGDTSNYNDDDNDSGGDSAERRTEKRPLRNREAVRKYREKKKAKAASLEEEVVKLRAINEQLMKRLQSRSALEAEASRLKCLLVDIRGRIEGEIGAFPYRKPSNLDSFQDIANPGL